MKVTILYIAQTIIYTVVVMLPVGKRRVAAAKLARSLGITMTNECAWIGPPDKDGFTPFGPDSRLDNIYQSLPQVSLHGMDEGLTLKLCAGVLNATIEEAVRLHKMNVTSVRMLCIYAFQQ
jgi:hypothetical protein